MTGNSKPGRTVAGVVDNDSAYASTVAAGGGYAFFSATGADESGKLSAAPQGVYARSDSAAARAEAETLYTSLKNALPEVGSGIDQVVQVEQYVRLKNHADGYFAAALRPTLLGTGTANGATAQIGTFVPADAAIQVTGMAVVPDAATGRVKTFPGSDGSPTGKFADPVGAGPYFFTTMFPMDRNLEGLPAGVKVGGWSWNESEIRSETKWAIDQLTAKLAAQGATLADIVNYSVLLADLGDLYEFDLLLREAIGDDLRAPSRSVLHLAGSALPRREGAFGHEEGAARLEIQFRCAIPGGDAITRVGTPTADSIARSGYQSAATKVDDIVWLSSQFASDGVLGSGAAEIDDIFTALAATCAEAGTDISQLLRARAQLSSAALVPDFYRALRKFVPDQPPAVTLAVTPTLAVPGAHVSIDGVALAL